MFCEKCGALFEGNVCPVCKNKKVREPEENDLYFLVEKEQIWGDMLADVDILSFPHHGIDNPLSVTKEVYKIVNPHLILVPGGERGVVRKFALHQAYAQTNPVILCSRDGNILVSTDGTDIWYAVQVEPGTFPLGEKLPPLENVR